MPNISVFLWSSEKYRAYGLWLNSANSCEIFHFLHLLYFCKTRSRIHRCYTGKSSLISALFRLYDFEGTIFIDGIDIKAVLLHTLRSRIAIIPQEPILFLGTLRHNLDPFNEYEDPHLWNALEDVELKDFVSSLPSGLESEILGGGSNFSVGQRQLFCLVKAILKNAKIVAFDEATASVDLETDEKIQKIQRIIRRKFKNSTVSFTFQKVQKS
jgi:ATP-binding cassette subfamily C (CFTR/MRP) protein 4